MPCRCDSDELVYQFIDRTHPEIEANQMIHCGACGRLLKAFGTRVAFSPETGKPLYVTDRCGIGAETNWGHALARRGEAVPSAVSGKPELVAR